MNISDQVCSIELAQKLKQLGVKQESLFYWQNQPYNDGTDDIVLMINEIHNDRNSNTIINTECETDDHPKYAAFTVAELGAMLPYEVNERFLIIEKCFCNLWQLKYSDEDYLRESVIVEIKDESEANARAQMLIYIIENKLIEVSK